jgi:serine/threonine-protein kinase
LKSPAARLLAPATQGLAAGDLIAQYGVQSKLGEGGMGAVYRAYDTGLHRQVALKVLPLEDLVDAERKGRMLLEARGADGGGAESSEHLHGV